jgi:hypothetical protein
MKFGKTIKIFLIDGEPNGRMSCELSNWSNSAEFIIQSKESLEIKQFSFCFKNLRHKKNY